MRRTSLRVAIVGWFLAITLLLPALNLTTRPLPAHADGEATPTPTLTPTPDGLGGDSDGDNG
jgi:hypothetical protein